jgi:thioredoxin reductase
MEFWRENMPRGMLLRSPWDAAEIADPRQELTLARYREQSGSWFESPVPLEDYIGYGEWYARNALPDLDERRIESVERVGDHFVLTVSDGDRIEARNVVVATGMRPFARRPSVFKGLPPELVSHAFEHSDFARLSGRRVLVVGCGQSALESAALLREAGAETALVARAPRVRWLQKRVLPRRIDRVLHPPSDVGPIGINWLIAAPDVYHRLSSRIQERLLTIAAPPAGAAWLRERVAGVPTRLGVAPVEATRVNGHVAVRLDDGEQVTADHVLLATGYHVDISRCGILSDRLLGAIRTTAGSPVLARNMESSVPGLFFVGASAARSFGPIMRFVTGTWFAAPAVTTAVTGRRRTLTLAFRHG